MKTKTRTKGRGNKRRGNEKIPALIPLPFIPLPSLDSDAALMREAFAAVGKTFRGEVWENARRFRLIGKAYESMPRAQDGFFDIATARQLTGPLRAWRHPGIRKILVRAAVQTFKSVILDLIIPYIIEHEPRNTLVLFEDDPKAKLYAKIRLMDTLRAHPVIGPMIVGVEETNRHGATQTYIKFPNMVLMVGGLNDGNVSSLSWPNVLISEAWLHKSDGLLGKAFGRTTQFEGNCKILVESQAGDADEDWDRECLAALPIPLTWACPGCGGRQTFEFSRQRPADFVGQGNKRQGNEDGEISASIPLPFIPLPAPSPGSYAGMTFDRDNQLLPVNGDWDIDAAALTAVWNCYYCGADLPDTPALRRQLMASYEQAIPEPPPRAVCFNWTKEAALSISFAESARSYLKAKKSEKQYGNRIPLRDWYRAERGIAWREDLARVLRVIAHESYDATKAWPDEWRRCLIVDNQHELQSQWASAWAVSRKGASHQLWRGALKGLPEVAAKQKELFIKDQWCFLDGAYMHADLVDACATHGHWGTVGRERVWLCWSLLIGSKWNDFAHKEDQNAKVRHPVSDPTEDFRQLGNFMVSVLTFNFSALQCGDMAAKHRDGKGPETLFLPETENPDSPLSWSAQIQSHVRKSVVSGRNGLPTDIWLPPTQNTPDHYWHVLRMLMAVFCIWEIDGIYEPVGSGIERPACVLEKE